jgi:sugar lactone lactonase YvrE
MKAYLWMTLAVLAVSTLWGADAIAPVSGLRDEAGHQDGTGSAARFSDPSGIARDSAGNLYVCDARNHVIRKIAPGGIVTTIAGLAGVSGSVNGTGSAARFCFPSDITIAPNGTLYVADTGNHCIRRITTAGVVTTLAGDLGSADDVDVSVGSTYATVAVDLDGSGSTARFNSPSGITYAPGDFLYVADTGNQLIRKVTLAGAATTVAGKVGEWGSVDGAGATARFSAPMGLCMGTDGNLYIADSMNHTIRCMTPQFAVSTYAGNADQATCKPGPRLVARFCEPTDITTHPAGGFIICDSFGNTVFRLTADGNVSLFAQEPDSSPQALANPNAAVCDAFGNVFVCDTFHQEVRLIIEKFSSSIQKVNGANQLTISWDSIIGRSYQLQTLTGQTWVNTSIPPIAATQARSSVTFPLPPQQSGIYRIVLLGF